MNTNYYKNVIMSGLFHSGSANLPKEYYLGFSGTFPNIDGTGVSEPSDTMGYSRVLLSDMTEPSAGVIRNSDIINFAESTSSWGKMVSYVVFDKAAGGNLLFYGNLGKEITVDANTVVSIPTGEMVISLLD